jgi:hypothetical protein
MHAIVAPLPPVCARVCAFDRVRAFIIIDAVHETLVLLEILARTIQGGEKKKRGG